jgi:hypothetical protein
MPKKPTGLIGPIRITADPISTKINFKKITWPKSKQKIEELVVLNFVRNIQKSGGNVLKYFHNSQNDLDYTLILPGGEVYLELKEVIFPIKKIKGKDNLVYSSNSHFWNYGDIENWFVELIKKYTIKYQGINKPIHLLFYSTHFDYNFDDEIIWLIQYTITKIDHIFECIFLYQPIDKNFVNLRVLYPNNAEKEFEDFKKSSGKDFIKKLRQKYFINLSPIKWEIGK